MTANSSIDPVQFLAEHIERAEPDLLRSMLTRFVEALMGTEQFPNPRRGAEHPPVGGDGRRGGGPIRCAGPARPGRRGRCRRPTPCWGHPPRAAWGRPRALRSC